VVFLRHRIGFIISKYVRDESNIPLLEQTKAKVRNCSFSINRGGKEREIEIASDDVCFFLDVYVV